MFDLYYWPTPNGCKVTILLHELDVPYNLVPLDIGKGDQFASDFARLNPNRRMPVIVDHAPVDGREPVALFESGGCWWESATTRFASSRWATAWELIS